MNPVEYPSLLWQLHHPVARQRAEFARLDNEIEHSGDEGLVKRIMTAFRSALSTELGDKDNPWLTHFSEISAAPFQILATGAD